METPYSRSWRWWSESHEGISALDGTGIGVCRHDEVYLKNRLKEAFAAGWNARSLEAERQPLTQEVKHGSETP